jgi:hypothetical protein
MTNWHAGVLFPGAVTHDEIDELVTAVMAATLPS